MRRNLAGIRRKQTGRRMAALALSFLFLTSPGTSFVGAESMTEQAAKSDIPADFPAVSSEAEDLPGGDLSYAEYQNLFGDRQEGKGDWRIDPLTYIEASGEVEKRTDIPGNFGEVLYTGEESSVTWRFEIPVEGRYQLRVVYYSIEGKGSDIGRTLLLDGAVPFEEARELSFGRVWEDDGEVLTDYQGNEIRPNAREVHMWQTASTKDASGYYNDTFWYYLTPGEHTLTLTATREPVVLGELVFTPPQALISYEDYQQEYAGKSDASMDGEKVQAEDMATRSAKSIYPTASKSSAAMEPVSSGAEKLNMIDGSKFRLPEQWVSWKVSVEEDGFYQIAVRYRQSERDGAYCSRRLFIDGEQPFAEAGELQFRYTGQWDVCWLSDGSGNPFRFYLTAGTHELKLQVTMGRMAELVGEVGDILEELNACYRAIYVITGADADQYRDYHFAELIPDTLEDNGKI